MQTISSVLYPFLLSGYNTTPRFHLRDPNPTIFFQSMAVLYSVTHIGVSPILPFRQSLKIHLTLLQDFYKMLLGGLKHLYSFYYPILITVYATPSITSGCSIQRLCQLPALEEFRQTLTWESNLHLNQAIQHWELPMSYRHCQV